MDVIKILQQQIEQLQERIAANERDPDWLACHNMLIRCIELYTNLVQRGYR
ncbi:hypothetical protein [Alicyclobacillus shizuokensis]|uniref:hypothetical protein n=1 Tax=Alicyclobacillus shizuokensis TaxID=392014 RepID=UPI000B206603|nr:hypothetical protein [Alicyclobacillus shizuokensis]